MVSREPKLKYGSFQIFDRVEVGQTQGLWSTKREAT
jgi:hypothetical protein